jgi:hypothetical protein
MAQVGVLHVATSAPFSTACRARGAEGLTRMIEHWPDTDSRSRGTAHPTCVLALACALTLGCGPKRDVFFPIDAGLDAPRYDSGTDAAPADSEVDPAPDTLEVRNCEEGVTRSMRGLPCNLGEGLICSVMTSECEALDGYCLGGVFDIRPRFACECRGDSDCAPPSYCEGHTCVPCGTTNPLDACPQCGGTVLPRLRNGCVTECVCGYAECDPSTPDSCGPGARCAVSTQCLSGCTQEEAGCCASACVEESCSGDLPIGCSLPCPTMDACGGSACAAARCSCARGRWLCEPGCTTPLPGCSLSCDLNVAFECSGAVSRNDFATCGASPHELHVVGQLRSTTGTVDVVVDRPGSVVYLSLVSATATHWNVTVRDERTRLTLVFLDGEGPSRASVPEGVSILDRTGPAYDFACAYEYPGSAPCDTEGLLSDLAFQTGLGSATSFTGCEEGRRYVLGTNP